MRTAALALCLLALALSAPRLASAQCAAGGAESRLVLTAVSAGCDDDPIAQCLSDFSLTTTTSCGMSIDADTLPDSAATVRLQKLWVSGGNIGRNSMTSLFPFIGSDAYAVCKERVASIASPVGSGSAAAAITALFNKVDSNNAAATYWAATGSAGSVSLVGGGCTLTYAVLNNDLDGTVTAVTSGADEDTVTLVDGKFAALVTQTGAKEFIAALCPSGTYSSRGGAVKTIKTGCDPVPAGSATNKVGATSAADVTTCVAGTYAAEGAGQCLPCATDMYAPLPGMDVCIECQTGYAPVEGSPRCFAGFGGNVYVTEGLDVRATSGTTKIYDPNGGLASIFDDAIPSPPAGQAIVSTDNTVDKVPELGGAAPGWSTISLPSGSTTGVPFLDTCLESGANTAAVLVSEDATAEVTLLGSTLCGQINGRTNDMVTPLPAGFSTPTPNMVNLTMLYASPIELIAFSTAAGSGSFVTLYLKATTVADASVTLSAKPQATAAGSLAAAATRTVGISSNNFGGSVAARPGSCPPGTAYYEKADAAGFTYAKMCRPCPDGYFCPSGRAGFSPVATACPAGTRGTVFGQKVSTSCVNCAAGYYQDTPGEMVCASCTASTDVAAKSCPTACKDGYVSTDPSTIACAACPKGDYRNGDMPICVTCPAGSQVLQVNSLTGVDTAIDVTTTDAGEDCKPCEPGFYNDKTTVGKCTACAAGTYSPRAGLATCLPCPAGSYQAATGQTSCKLAPKGKYISSTGSSTSGTDCPVGYFGEVAGGRTVDTACKKCKPGTVNNVAGSTTCTICKIGSYQDRSGQTTCTACPAGTVNTKPGSPTCNICAAGSFSQKGASVCSKCPVGTFQDKAKNSGCKPCPSGTFCSQEGTVAATKCPAGTYAPRPNGTSQRLACLPCAGSSKEGATTCANTTGK